MTSRPSALVLAFVVAIVALLAAPMVAARPSPAPAPDEAPHGIANQAAEQQPAVSAAVPDTGPVAVPEPSEKALRHARSGDWLWLVDQLWGLLLPGVILFTGFSAKLRDTAHRIGRNWYFTIVVYVAMFFLLTFIIGLPLSYYTGFARPHAYGLSNQTLGKWCGDELKGLMVGLIMGGLLIWIPYWLIKKSPRRWWLWTSLVAIPLTAFFMLLAPIVIDPLFNKFGPMKDKVLEGRILDLAGRAGIEGARVFEVDKSADTNTVNAYVTGFGGSKRIVLWDTTIAKLQPDELLFVMGHEMGHYVLGHVVRSVFFGAALILITLWAFDRLQRGFVARYSNRFGFTELADIASIPLVLLLVGVLSFVITPVAAGYSRWQEHEADRFGLEITRNNHAAATAFVKLQQENLGVPRRGLLFKLWRADHPLLGDRIDFCNAYRPWDEGKPGRYDKLFKP
jgi:Zn-dependent protease with chaperone function